MKKILKVLAWAIASLLLVILFAGLYIYLSDIPSYQVEVVDVQLDRSPAEVERGKKLATMLCASCHMDKETGKLTGKRMLDVPTEFGEIYSQNITQDKTNGIGSWTDGEIVFLLRTGIKKDGQYSPPYMAKLPKMADADINAIVAFLRSDDPIVVANSKANTPSKPSLLTKFLCRVAFKPFEMPIDPIPRPDTSNLIELGRYLAHNLDCFSCHSVDFKSNDYLEPTQSVGYFAGGNKILDEKGRIKIAPNLTPDKETGIGTWTQVDFIQAVKYGIKKGEQALTYPMMPYTQLTDKETGAIFTYLQTISPVHNLVERSIYN
ncbi:MAG: c-type cytochrome [Saprospiraceae bacterium]|nr:c-type cytochrome [Saprospiraceae bacterium]